MNIQQSFKVKYGLVALTRAYSSEISAARVPTKGENKTETEKNDSIFLKKETQVDAGIFKGQLTFKVQTQTSTNSILFRYDYWKWILDFLETVSHRNQMQLAQIKSLDLMEEYQNVVTSKREIEKELETVRRKLITNYVAKDLELCNRASIDYLRYVAREEELQVEERRLTSALRNSTVNECQLFDKFLNAIQESYEAESLHSRFLRASIFISICLTLILTSFFWYGYNYYLIQETVSAADRIRELNEKLRSKFQPLDVNKESWGSYLKGYVRPLYSWAVPKK